MDDGFKEDENMSVASVTSQTQVYDSYNAQNAAKASDAAKKEDAAKKTEETKKDGVVYEKNEKNEEKSDTSKKATYSVNKMSADDRAALVKQLKADQESRQQQLVSIVQQMMTKQATTYANANDIWKFLAKGDFTVDAQTKLQAQKDIADDGYYGVQQTADRLFDFASALAGDDVEKMKKMQAAMQKGFDQATKAWGQKLPDISQRTMDAANKKFEEYYKSKNSTSSDAKSASETEA